jgi:hypothetical protein
LFTTAPLVCAFVLAVGGNSIATNIVMIRIVTITNNFSFVSICFFVVRKVRYIRYFIPAHKNTQVNRCKINSLILILVDSWQNPKVTDLIGQTIEDKFKKKDEVKVRSILLRPAGMMVVFVAVHIEVDGNKRLADVELLTRQVEIIIRSKTPYIKKISMIPHSLTSSPILSESMPI